MIARSFSDILLSPCIRPMVELGERSDRSHDGKTVLFPNKSGGNAYEVEMTTRKIRSIAKTPEGEAYWRTWYLSNGYCFITRGAGRNSTHAYILNKGFEKSPVQLNTVIQEVPAISRTRMRIAYTPTSSRIGGTWSKPNLDSGCLILFRFRLFIISPKSDGWS